MNSIISYKVFHTFLLHFYIFLVNISISTPQWLPVTRRFGTRSTELKDSVPRTKDRGELGYILRIPHLSRRSWQVVLRMSTTPSVLSCLHRMEVAMKQPVRPIPALRKRKKVGWEEEKMDGLAYWLVNLVNVKSSVGTSDTRGLDDEKNTHTFTANITNKLSYLQWTIVGPLEGGASSRALSTSCTSSRRGGALSGVFWSGHEVYQYCRRLRSSPPHWYTTSTHKQHTEG